MPFPRMTTRRWMLAVAAVAVALGGLETKRLQAHHERLALYHEVLEYLLRHGHADTPPNAARAAYHARLRDKYRRAARRPWLPVPPDPPPGE